MEKQAVVHTAVEGSIAGPAGQALDAGRAVPATAVVPATAAARLFFVDNIRVFLTILVILHHLMITYSGTGQWYYNEGTADALTGYAGGWFCSINQAYFMGLFLLISAYFVPGSYDRKGAGRFVKDRLIRLGIPLAVFSWVLHPLFVYGALVLGNQVHTSFWRFIATEYFSKYGQPVIGAGPLWFVEVLLIFSLVYVLWRVVFGARLGDAARPVPAVVDARFPGNGSIALFALLLGVVTFLVRLVFPMDDYLFQPLNLKLGFFAQYIALFVVGLIAYRRNWLLGLPDKTGRLWLGIAALFVVLGVGIHGAIASGAMSSALKNGGWHWESLTYALWESFLCVSMCIGVIYPFRRYLNRRGKLAGFLVPNAYTAYLIHALVITSVAFAARDLLPLYPLLKWVVLALVTVPLCFGLSALIRKVPYTDRVL